jgi:hypothetical protein
MFKVREHPKCVPCQNIKRRRSELDILQGELRKLKPPHLMEIIGRVKMLKLGCWA